MGHRAERTSRGCSLVPALAALAIAGASVPVATAGDGTDIHWQSPLEVAAGDAYRGPWRMNHSRFHYVDDPTVALADDGRVGVAWVQNRLQDIYFRVYGPGGRPAFGQATNVSRSTGTFSWLPKVVMAGAGEVYVLWQEIVFSGGSHGGEAFFARSSDGGGSFSTPLNLSNSEAGDGKGRLTSERWHNGSLDLARAPDGTLHAVWTEYEGALWASRSTDGGRSFSTPLRAGGSGEAPARAPNLAIGSDGMVHLAWTVGEDSHADLRLAVSRDGGRSFGEPRLLLAGEGHADAPKIAVGDGGGLHLVYAEGSEGPCGPHHVRYAWLAPDRLTASASRPVTRPDHPAGAHYPQLATSGDSLVLTWEHYPEAGDRPYGLGYSVATGREGSFSPPRVIPGTAEYPLGFNGSLQGFLMRKLDANPDGAIGVVNSRIAPGRRSVVRLIRGTLNP